MPCAHGHDSVDIQGALPVPSTEKPRSLEKLNSAPGDLGPNSREPLWIPGGKGQNGKPQNCIASRRS